MNRFYIAAFFGAASFLLAACGGGGPNGGGCGVAICPPPSTPTPAVTQTPSATSATGVLVDDPSGTPLMGVAVRLDPWAAYPTPGPSPTPISTTATDATGHFSISAKNGTYLLVIGSDSNTNTTRPTIHDKLVLTGQTVLAAPTMPPLPGITPAPVEANGDYRLVSIDQRIELPCIQNYDAQRAQRSLPNPVVDEWLTENVRAAIAQSITPYNGKTDPRNPYGFLTTGNATQEAGTSCATMMASAFAGNGATPYATVSPWFAGSYLPYQQSNGTQPAYGASLFPYDPRLTPDPNVPNWP